jgi:hypothetical protein
MAYSALAVYGGFSPWLLCGENCTDLPCPLQRPFHLCNWPRVVSGVPQKVPTFEMSDIYTLEQKEYNGTAVVCTISKWKGDLRT